MTPDQFESRDGVYILNCRAFDDEIAYRFTNVCCEDCHQKGEHHFTYIRPRRPNWPEDQNSDMSFGIEANVCCGRVHFVRSLSREWWARKAAEINGWDEEKVQQLLNPGSWHKHFEAKYQKATAKPTAKKDDLTGYQGVKAETVKADMSLDDLENLFK